MRWTHANDEIREAKLIFLHTLWAKMIVKSDKKKLDISI